MYTKTNHSTRECLVQSAIRINHQTLQREPKGWSDPTPQSNEPPKAPSTDTVGKANEPEKREMGGSDTADLH